MHYTSGVYASIRQLSEVDQLQTAFAHSCKRDSPNCFTTGNYLAIQVNTRRER